MVRQFAYEVVGWGVGELVGQVLSENHRLLAMCRELGFSIAADPNDPRIMQVRKVLMPQAPRASA